LWNVDSFTKVAMYVLAAVATGIFAYGVWRRVRGWRRGLPGKQELPAQGSAGQKYVADGDALDSSAELAPGVPVHSTPLIRTLRHVVIQQRIGRIPWAWLSHAGIFYGFIVLFIGTVIVGLEHYGIFGLFGISWTGRFYTFTSFWLDLFGMVFLAAVGIALGRRIGLTPRVRPSSKAIDAVLLWLFMLIGVTGFVVEGLRIAYDFPPFERGVSFIGWWLAQAFATFGLSGEAVRPWHLSAWWLHMVLVMAFIAVIPYTKLLHFVVAPFYIALTPEHRSGRLRPVSLEEVEETGRVGLADITDFTRRQLASYDACTHCRRCESACPAYVTGKPLSPMKVILDIARNAEHQGSLHGDVISAETLWSCTTCGACVHNCPVLIDQMGTIVDMRRHLVGEGQVVGSSQAALRTIASQGNPWGLPPDERADWAAGMDVPTVDDNATPDVLLWVGCSGSYDRRNQQVTRALAKVLKAAGVNYAILGKKERCTGDPARRIGDEFTFLEQATANVETLSKVPFKRIVTQCAHCFNTLKNEYPDFGGDYHVTHHTAYLQELIHSGKLPPAAAAAAQDATNSASAGQAAGPIVFHDPCYLSRHNDGSQPPRAVLSSETAGSLTIVEPERSGCNTFCCGAGGGRMWMEEQIDQRVNVARWEELKATGAKTVAVGCPFCMTMLDDASKADAESGVVVKDVAEIVAAALPDNSQSPRGD
jgi:Fe-S oxidoreductase/nitrate reductase gamma subunit